jgi:hypothetical protein
MYCAYFILNHRNLCHTQQTWPMHCNWSRSSWKQTLQTNPCQSLTAETQRLVLATATPSALEDRARQESGTSGKTQESVASQSDSHHSVLLTATTITSEPSTQIRPHIRPLTQIYVLQTVILNHRDICHAQPLKPAHGTLDPHVLHTCQ